MSVFVAGSTGVLGRRIVSQLSERGHDVGGLVHDEAGADFVRARVAPRGMATSSSETPSSTPRATPSSTRRPPSRPTRDPRNRTGSTTIEFERPAAGIFSRRPRRPTPNDSCFRWLEVGTIRETNDGYEWVGEE